MKKLLVLMLSIASVLLMAAFASAVEPAGANVLNQLNQGEFQVAAAENVTVEAGNITEANLSTNISTYRWAAIFGLAGGEMKLGDDDNNILYDWAADGRVVYACEDPNPTWADFTEANEAAVTGVYTFLAGATNSDSYSNTFANSDTLDSGIFAGATTPGAGDYVDTYNDAEVATWRTFSLWDTANIIFAAEVQESGTSYSGTTTDFQLLVPEDGTAGDAAASIYWLWLELI
ncbi:MAG: hypothetical protein V1659_02045 [Candidatus Woesearchaeota archaeon]